MLGAFEGLRNRVSHWTTKGSARCGARNAGASKQLRSPDRSSTISRAPRRRWHCASAPGLAFAAFLPRYFTEPFIKAELKIGNSLNLFARERAAIDRLIVQVREQGYSYNDGHLMPGVSAIALPLFDRTTKLVAVLAAMGRPERVNPRDGADMIACLKGETRNFSR